MGEFKLTKFISNKKDILFQFPDALRRDGAKDKDLTGSLPIERALGIFWDAENDVIKFKIDLKDQPITRGGMLSALSSIYDPLGLPCQFLLQGRRLLQGLCQVMHVWDEMFPDNICQKWEAWKSSLKGLEKICIRRCIKPEGFGIIKEASLHHFSDASEESYRQSTFLRLVNVSGKIHCCLLMGKSRVTPKKYVTIPRLELVAAVLSVKIAALIRRELDNEWKNETFWADSKVVLGYINNNTKRFKIFVANRIQQIHEGSNVSQWRYVPSKMYPADDTSRGLDANKNKSFSNWFKGPKFLWHNETSWPAEKTEATTDEDPEVKNLLIVNRIAENYGMLLYLTERISGWKKLKKIVAIMIQYKQKLLKIIRQKRQCIILKITHQKNHIKMFPCCRKQTPKLSKCVKLGIFGKR